MFSKILGVFFCFVQPVGVGKDFVAGSDLGFKVTKKKYYSLLLSPSSMSSVTGLFVLFEIPVLVFPDHVCRVSIEFSFYLNL